MTAVLVIEDDDRIRLVAAARAGGRGLRRPRRGHRRGGPARAAPAPGRHVLVDLMLPGLDGFECIRQLRRDDDVPIVVVSARDDTHDIVAALEAGADDYVVKPVAIKELSARLRALRRRARPVSRRRRCPVAGASASWRSGRRPGRCACAAQPVAVTRTEFRLLCELAEHAGRVLSRQQLLQRVWGYDIGDERLVDVHVGRLRQKIEDDPAHAAAPGDRARPGLQAAAMRRPRAADPGRPPGSPSARCCSRRRWRWSSYELTRSVPARRAGAHPRCGPPTSTPPWCSAGLRHRPARRRWRCCGRWTPAAAGGPVLHRDGEWYARNADTGAAPPPSRPSLQRRGRRRAAGRAAGPHRRRTRPGGRHAAARGTRVLRGRLAARAGPDPAGAGAGADPGRGRPSPAAGAAAGLVRHPARAAPAARGRRRGRRRSPPATSPPGSTRPPSPTWSG